MRAPTGSPRPGRRRPSLPVAGGLGQLGVALPLSPPCAAPLAPGGELPPAASRSGEVSASGDRFRPSGPAQPWSHAVADAPSAPPIPSTVVGPTRLGGDDDPAPPPSRQRRLAGAALAQGGSRPADIAAKIAMRQQFVSWSIARHTHQGHLQARPARVLHRWNTISIVGHQRQQLD